MKIAISKDNDDLIKVFEGQEAVFLINALTKIINEHNENEAKCQEAFENLLECLKAEK